MKHLIMGTAGHVDHGKTSLIKALTNIDCDTHKEEKERGITINLGFSHIDLPSGHSVGIIDVPGHKDFINTMVGGASSIDFVLMVIAADSGIMPQTSEHFNIIETLNIKKAIIALNKIDLVDEELAELAKLEVMEWLEDTPYQDSPIIGVSSTTGQGLDELIAEIDKMIPQIEEKEKGHFFRMFVDRIFTVKGIGSVVTGSVLNGEIKVGQDLFLLPGNKQKLRIRSIEKHGETVDAVVSGDRAAFNLSGLKTEDFKRGMLLTNKDLETTTMIDAHISLFDNADDLKLWSSIIFHSGTFESQARMHLLNKDRLTAGEDAIVQIHLEKETIVINKDKFVIRNTSGNKSYGGGVIIDAQPLHHRKRTPKLLDALELLASGVLNEGNIAELIKIELKKENNPVLADELAGNLNIQVTELLSEIESLDVVISYQPDQQNILILSSVENDYKKQIVDLIQQHHQKNYILNSGLEEVEFYGKFGFSKNKTAKLYTGLLLKKMKAEKLLDVYKNTWIIPGHQATIDNKTQAEIEALNQFIKDFDMRLPTMAEIKTWAQDRRITVESLKLYISYLTNRKSLVHYKNELIHREIVDGLKKKILHFLNTSDDGFYIAEIREITGLTKKLAPFILEYFKDEGWIITSDYNKNSFNSKLTAKGRSEMGF